MKITKGLVVAGLGIVVLALCGSFGCGGSSSSTSAGTTGDDITVSGAIEVPSGVSASISRGLGAKTLTDVACPDGLTVTIYDIEDDWEEVGTGTTSGGTASVDVAVDDIHPADETGTTYTVPLVMVAENTDETIHIETYVEADVVEGTTTTVDLGTANVDSTLAAQSLWSAAGCAIGTACTFNIDPFCYFRSQHAVFGNSSVSGDGLADDTAAIRDMVAAAMAGGESPANYGYANWGAMMADTLQGDLPAAAQTAFATHAQGFVDGAAENFYASNYTSGAEAFSALDSIFGMQLAGGEGLTSLASLSKDATTSDGSACDNIRDSEIGDDYVGGLIDTFLACENPTECTGIYGNDECFEVALGIMNEYQGAGTLGSLDGTGAVVQGYISGLGDEGCAGFFDGGAFDDRKFGDLYEVFESFDPNAVQNHDEMRDWGRSWEGTIEAQGWEGFRGEDGTFDDSQIDYHTNFYNGEVVGSGYDPTMIDFGALGEELEGRYDTMAGNPTMQGQYDQCIAAGNTFDLCSGGGPDPGTFERDQPMDEPDFGGGFSCTTNAECAGGFQCVASRCEPPTMPPM